MIGNILAESSEECQRLLDALGDMGLTNFDLEDTVGVLLLCRVWEGSDECLWSAGIVVRYGDRSLYVTRGILEFDEHNASH